MNKNEMPEPEKEFLKWLESATERELWSGNYNRATRDEYIAHRVWLHFSKKLEIAIEALEKIRDVGDTYKDTNLAGYELAVACWGASTISAEEALKELKCESK